jgi:hypothetical protein
MNREELKEMVKAQFAIEHDAAIDRATDRLYEQLKDVEIEKPRFRDNEIVFDTDTGLYSLAADAGEDGRKLSPAEVAAIVAEEDDCEWYVKENGELYIGTGCSIGARYITKCPDWEPEKGEIK